MGIPYNTRKRKLSHSVNGGNSVVVITKQKFGHDNNNKQCRPF